MSIGAKLGRLLRSRRLGIKPRARKAAALRSRVMPSPIPPRLILPLVQPGLPAAVPLPDTGQWVHKYEAVAVTEDDGVPCLFAPTSGQIGFPDGAAAADKEMAPCMFLLSDGEDRAAPAQDSPDYRTLSHRQLLERLAGAGIVDCGTDSQPLAHKLKQGMAQKAGLLLINAMECEPDVSANESLIREYAEQVVAGAEVLQAASLTSRCQIAITADKPDAVTSLRTALANSAIELILLPPGYPAGHDRVLTRTLTGLKLDWRQQPSDAGLVICDAGTAYQAHQAVIEGRPVIDRIVTVGGSGVRTPKNFKALIGTPLSYLLELCGASPGALHRIIIGDSITGMILGNPQQPVTQSTKSLLATTSGELAATGVQSACIRCGRCSSACAVDLQPQQLYFAANRHDPAALWDLGMLECIECGACAWTCPSRLPLLSLFRESRRELLRLAEQQQAASGWRQRFEFLQQRRRQPGKSEPAQDQRDAGKPGAFSREAARREIAGAVARVKARRKGVIAASGSSQPTGEGDD